jgi:DNA-3-methyladenine glycosylase I
MSSDVIIGHDGKPRCTWAGTGDTDLGRYHDEVWGTRTHDESAMFEALTLGVFQVGLSWAIVFAKRDAFRKAFRRFDVAKVAAMTARDVDRLVQDASIIRNRGKIQATLDNAHAMMSASPSPRGAREILRDHPQTGTTVPRGPTHLDPAGGGVREAAEVAGVPLRRPNERVRIHAERRRDQRPHPRMLPRDRLSRHGPEPLRTWSIHGAERAQTAAMPRAAAGVASR